MKKKVAVGLSGGVDSAVSASLLVEAGYEVVGVFLECWRAPGCRVDEDRKDAMDVAMKLGIPFRVLDFKREYKERVVEYFYREYEAGRTPNPDTMCNKEIKFGMFYDWAIGKGPASTRDDSTRGGFDFIATGHYARVATRHSLYGNSKTAYSAVSNAQSFGGQAGHYARIGVRSLRSDDSFRSYRKRTGIEIDRMHVGRARDSLGSIRFDEKEHPPRELTKSGEFVTHDQLGGKFNLVRFDEKEHPPRELVLMRGIDENKDQSYFLYLLRGEQLPHVLFPIGHLTKPQVREEAKKRGLAVADKPDSVGICFIGDINVRKFLEDRLPVTKGEVVSVEGEVIGEHDGVWFYTVGQRHGFTIFGKYKSKSGQWKHALPPLYVVDKDVKTNRLVVGFGVETLKKEFLVEQAHWINSNYQLPMINGQLSVRIRHRGKILDAIIQNNELGMVVTLQEPQKGVASGQAAVFYQGEVCLGGGIIV